MKLLFLSLFIFQSFNLLADGIIKGRIIDSKDKKPIEYVSIWTSNNSAISDKKGNFIIKASEFDTLRIHFIGYHFTGIAGFKWNNDTVFLDSIPLIQQYEIFCDIKDTTNYVLQEIKNTCFLYQNNIYSPFIYIGNSNMILYNLQKKQLKKNSLND
ncbi:MAG: carboxypeptidase-like regulatory domain-containing protein [Bacteroidota bacterium]